MKRILQKMRGKLFNTKRRVEKSLLFVFMQISLFLIAFSAVGQGGATNEAEWTGFGYALKKVVSNVSIQSGVNFSYTIMFSAPAGATSITIQDQIPTALEVVNVPTPAPVNGVTPAVNVTGTPGVNELVTYSLTGLPAGSASSGSFTIVVKFPEGTTCDGESARNRAAILINDEPFYTPFVSTTAQAADPWKISKSILSGAVVNPNGGSCGYMMLPDDTVKYRLYVMKNSPYWGNVTGQMNMTSAVVTDVLPAGAVLISSTCGATQVGNTITWTVNSPSQILDAANPYAWYYCDIEVYYPATSFPTGSTINNDATLSGTMCNQQVSHTSNQTCIEVLNYSPNLSANFQKYLSLTNRVPGCTGIYTIVFCNNGNTPLSAFDINDAVPSGITVDEIKIFNANTTTTVDLNINSSAYATGITSTYNSGPISTSVNNIQLQMTGTLPVGDCIYMYVYFTVDPNPTGTVVTNCASFDGLSNALTLNDACVSFTVEEGAPKPCLIKDICSPQSSYDPGDILRFRIRVQNIGSADLTGATLQDLLHSNFNYIGNETYYFINNYNPPCSSGAGLPSGATAWTGVNPVHSGNNLSWTLPDIPADCQLFYTAYCGTYGTYALPYYFIEFDVAVDSFAMPGVTPNEYEISGGNLISTVTSNTVNVLVVASFGQEVEKQVSTDGGATFASSGSVNPGGTARYQLNYKNVSNVPVSGINLVDLLPLNDSPNDWLILDRTTSRGSTFGVSYNANHSTGLVPGGTGPTPTLGYSPGSNLCLPIFGYSPGGCAPPAWSATPDQNVKMDYATFALGPNVKLQEEFDVNIPSNATIQQTACNDFAAIATADFLLDGTPQSVALTPIAAPPVCVSVDTTSTSCCDSIRIEQVSDPTVADDCCVRITTECEVKAITVNVSNGSISTAAWNCGNLPSGFQGQSSFTFPANGCVVDMTNCIKPDQPGPVTVSFVINFQNGEECEKSIELDCGEVQENCCDSIQVRQLMLADDTKLCCTELTTTCKVDSVLVNVSNGTFSSNAWNCATPIPTAAIGQSSYMFVAGGCDDLDLENCIEPDQTGVVTVNYLVYFSNGEVCEKGLEMDCVAEEKNCCDSIQVRQVINAAGMSECCTELITTCEVDSVLVTLNNGTFSSNTWNCTSPIPTAAIGQSSYMFDATGCVVNMTNCIEPDQTGVVTVNYLVFFSNGEKCEKGFELDCVAEEKNCCDSLKVDAVQDPDLGDCCIKLSTECEVDSVVMNVSNGTFSTANWNCGSLSNDYIGESSYTFNAAQCAVNMTACVEPDSTGIVTVDYTVYYTNGEVCEGRLQMDCEATASECCENVKVNVYQDPDLGECCAQFISECETDSIVVSISNGTFSAATLNGTSLSSGFTGQSSFTFDTNSTSADLLTCVSPDSTGVVMISYVAYFTNGEICEKRIEMDCKAPEPVSDCCPVVDFKLRRSWPFFTKYVGTFEIINPDPSNPICSVEISSSPAGSFNTGTLIIDGTASGQSWTSTSIPATGTLSPQAVNDMLFTLTAFNYKGTVTICVIKCDGTECCYEFNWNGKPIVVTPWEPVQLGVDKKLVAVSVSPELDESVEESIKYVSFGFANEDDLNDDAEFFAIGGSGDCDDGNAEPIPGALDPDDDDDGISDGTESIMSRHNAFFELNCPYRPGSGDPAPTFNLVLKGELPQLGMALISEEGNVIFDGEIDLANPDSVISSVINPGDVSGKMFEFSNLYPNPTDGSFRVTYATDNQQDVEIRVVNPLGQTIKVLNPKENFPGVHNTDIDASDLAGGMYRVFLYSGGEVRSRSVVIDR